MVLAISEIARFLVRIFSRGDSLPSQLTVISGQILSAVPMIALAAEMRPPRR